MVDWLVEAGTWLFDWLVGWLVSLGEAAWGGLVEAIPGMEGTTLEPFAVWLSVANQYVPLDLAVLLLGSYWSFVALFTGAKFLLKLIPGIG